jgi:peroxiredoxin
MMSARSAEQARFLWERRLLYAAVMVAGLAMVVLVRQYDDLRQRYRALTQRLQWPHAGYSVPTFHAVTIDGDSITVGRADGGRQLLIVFTTACPYCRASVGAWRRIIDATNREAPHVTTLGITLDGGGSVQEYRREHDLRIPVLMFPDDKLRRLYRARSVPLLVLLDSTGRVLYSRLGALEDEAAIDSVLDALTSPDPVRDDIVADRTLAEAGL